MQDKCELRLDIPLLNGGTAQDWERGWRAALQAQHLTALALPPAQALSARFCVCNLPGDTSLSRYLPHRLHALPGGPEVQAETPAAPDNWRGVRVWLSYRAQDLPALLARPKRKPSPFAAVRGKRP